MVTKQVSGISAEPWYKSRRMWGAVIGAAALVTTAFLPDYEGNIDQIAQAIGTLLGIALPTWSWVRPK